MMVLFVRDISDPGGWPLVSTECMAQGLEFTISGIWNTDLSVSMTGDPVRHFCSEQTTKQVCNVVVLTLYQVTRQCCGTNFVPRML